MCLVGKNKFGRQSIFLLLIFICLNASAQKKPYSYAYHIQTLQSNAEKYYLGGKYDQAVRLFNQAIALASKAKDIPTHANLLVESSNLNFYSVSPAKALSQCSKALALLPASSLDSIRFKAYSNLSYFYNELYKSDSAQYYYLLADQLLETKPFLINQTPMYVAAYYNQHGMSYNSIGDFSQAEINFQKAISLAYQYNLESLYTYFENNLSGLYVNLGQYNKALSIALSSLKHSKEQFQNIPFLINISDIYYKLSKLDQTKAYLLKAQALIDSHKRNGETENSGSEPMLWRNWGQYYAAIHQYSLAINAYNRSIKLGTKIWGPHHNYLSSIYQEKAQLLQKQNNLEGALENYRQAINAVYVGNPIKSYRELPDISHGIISEHELLEALIGQASVLKQLSINDTYLLPSFRTYQLVLKLAERIRLNYDVADTKLLFGQQISAVNENALAIAYELYKKGKNPFYLYQAFNFIESTRASTLSDARREQSLKKVFVPEDLQLQEGQLKALISSLKVQLMQPVSDTEKKKIKLKLLEEELNLDKLRHKLRHYIPDQQRQASQPVQIATVQNKLLEPATALVSYVMTQRNAYAFVITRKQVKWIQIPFTKKEKTLLAQLQKSLYSNPGIDSYKGHDLAYEAYQTLFAPLKSTLTHINRLIIIRDKELNYLPFEVLEQSKNQNNYLLKTYSIRYAYGASLAQIQSMNPELKGPRKSLAMAPFSDSSIQKNLMRDQSLSPLPASLEEIQAVRGKQFINKTATKKEFLNNYKSAEVIHLATHARTDDKEAERSFIAFYPDSSNYKLYTNELYNLSFDHTRMIVLSACETGRGRLHSGEGLMSLARGFLYGGCPSVVTTLWNAHDQSSAFLSERMYYHLHEGLPIDKALQQAKLDFFSSKLAASYDHPYYWANLVLIGDANVIYPSHWVTMGRITLGFCLLAGVFLGMFFFRYQMYHKK